MDRNVVIATILIALIMVVWLTWLTPPPPVQTPDSLDSSRVEQAPVVEAPETVSVGRESLRSIQQLEADSTISGAAVGQEESVVIVTDLYKARLSTRGATITSFELAEYRDALDSTAVQLVDQEAGAVAVVFTTPANRVYDSRSFFFESEQAGDSLVVGDQPAVVRFLTRIGDGSLEHVYTFSRETYEVGLSVGMTNSEGFLTPAGYEVIWNGAIPFTEINIEQDALASGAFARSGGEVESVLAKGDAYQENSIRGDVDWVGVKSKYFAAVVIPDIPGRAAELISERSGDLAAPDLSLFYSASLAMPSPTQTDAFRLYLGPMELSRIRQYDLGLYDMVDYGWDFFETVTRPLAKFVFVPVFDFLHTFIPSWGLVIIIFSILVKGALYPLTKSSFTSMAKMRELQPRMEAIKAKHPDSPQKQQEAMMKMYKETGVNPIGGCLPMLLQYPIIIALWQFLPQAIEIRQQGFLWATDLSAPDIILNLPFTIPLYGSFISGFTILMGVSMVFQMRLQASPSTNAQAKIFTYVFPVMIFVIFNRLAAGLNLYYLCYNVLSAVQQSYINRRLHQHPEELQPVKTAGKKGGRAKGGTGSKGRRAKR